jgi:hypothetical protein
MALGPVAMNPYPDSNEDEEYSKKGAFAICVKVAKIGGRF